MTREEILAMEPGYELDRLVAETVMNWHLVSGAMFSDWVDSGGLKKCGKEWFNPSTDIKVAWEVVKRIKENKLFSVRRMFMDMLQIIISRKVAPNEVWLVMWPDVMWHVEPVDFCKAALLAVLEVD
jgi:hypothetical protein